MHNQKRIGLLRNVLVLVTLVGLVLLSWLAGHILRYSIPALWHPPVQESDPQIKIGVEFGLEGIRRAVVLPGLAPGTVPTRVQFDEALAVLPIECRDPTYFTSLPAKCLTVDGRLVRVGGFESYATIEKYWFSRFCREKSRIWGCERANARAHPQIRVPTTEIPEEPK